MKVTIEKGISNIRQYVTVGLGTLIVFNIFFNIISIESENIAILLSLIYLGVVLFCFVNSIRHLVYYSNGKGIAIITLIISGFNLVLWILSFSMGFIQEVIKI